MATYWKASFASLAAFAHELNNPLAAVLANLELARERLQPLIEQGMIPRAMLELIDDALAATERTRRIVSDWKAFSGATDDRREAVDVERVMDATLVLVQEQLRDRASVVKEYGGVPLVAGNESRIGQVFLNLVVNAAQAIPEGNPSSNVVRISTALGANGVVEVRVIDTGTGIAPDLRERLFAPFVTTKPSGTGLGLCVARGIIASLGGELSFETEVGKGTEFRIVLPVAEPSVAAPPRRRARILVIDDEVFVTSAVVRLLAEHAVVAATDVREALALLRLERFDVVLCDLLLPYMTGMELHAEIATLDPAQARRFVFMTGGAFTPHARAFLAASENARIEKPFDVAHLRAIVNRLID